MITNPRQIAEIAERLRVYDVDQGAWEQEGNGFEANVGHVLLHLVKDDVNPDKDFSDPQTVQAAIAPDALAYALRISRWGGQDLEELVDAEQEIALSRYQRLASPMFTAHQEIFRAAIWSLASNFHDLSHESEKAEAQKARPEVVRESSALLLICANVQCFDYGFDLEKSFDDRLAELRLRFGIPEPE